MTRKEKIRNAATQYATHLVDTDVTDFHGKYETKMDFVLGEHNAFLAGAKFADEHPKCKWISVADYLPCNHKELITKDGIATLPVPTISYDGLLELHNMVKVMSSKGGDRWIWEEGISPKYWFKLPELK